MWKYLPYLFLLACPVMMVIMMRGVGHGSDMGHRMGGKKSDGHTHDVPPASVAWTTQVGPRGGRASDTHDPAAEEWPPGLDVPAGKQA